MKAIQLENIRSLKNTGSIPIQPITLLLGENSSGKSTFLRIFPLLKQSIQKKTNGPILWAGDVDDYVDFGSFDETVTNDGSNSMRLTFSFEIPFDQFFSQMYLDTNRWFPKKNPFSINYSILVEKRTDKEFVSELAVTINETEIKLSRLQDKYPTVCVDGEDVCFSPLNDSDSDDTERYFFWRIYSGRSVFGIHMPNIARWVRHELKQFLDSDLKQDLIDEYHEFALLSIGDALFNGVAIQDVKNAFFEEKNNKRKKSRGQSSIYSRIEKTILRIFENIEGLSDEESLYTTHLIELLYFYVNYNEIEEYIRAYYSQVHYIAPLRATAERYYRLRNSAIDEVDYQGKNLAIFLNSLPAQRMRQFQEWTVRHFGFKTIVTKNVGHLSVEITRSGNEKAINLSDTGFGYSQILPIITQLWELSSRERNSRKAKQVVPLVIAIEQPELHLHPAMQARLAESFIACLDLAKENGYLLQLILETHSETMINYFGRAIAREKLNPDEVAIVLFEKDEISNKTYTSTSKYDNDGFLCNWPIGFFSPEE